MNTFTYFKDLIAQQKMGEPGEICSICSAHSVVLEAAMEYYNSKGKALLIESTANQVNQYGGYTHMTPEDFKNYVFRIAKRIGFPTGQLILGGDHLGPLIWADRPEEEAVRESEILITDYIKAGFKKIHIDTSMRFAGDDGKIPPSTVIAGRAA